MASTATALAKVSKLPPSSDKKKPGPNSVASQAKSLDAFLIYAQMGPTRSLARLKEKLGDSVPSLISIENWSRRDKWQERVAAFDRMVAEQVLADAAKSEAKEGMRRRRERLELASVGKAVVKDFLFDSEKKQPRTKQRPGDRGVGISARELEVATSALQRLSDVEVRDMGEATERSEVGVIIRQYDGFNIDDV